MHIIKSFAIVASCASFLVCGPASADAGNPFVGVSSGYAAPPNTLPMPKAPSLMPTMKPAPAVNPRNIKPRPAAKPYAAKSVCYGMHPASAAPAPRVRTATRVPPNCLTIDGNTGRCITNGQIPLPPPGVPVGTTSDPGPEAQRPGQDVKPRRAAKPYAVKSVCYGMHPASAGSARRGGAASGGAQN